MVPRRKIALGLLLLVSLSLALAFVSHHQAKWAVERYKRKLAAAGEKLEVEQLLLIPPLPESNGAPVFVRAMAGLSAVGGLLETNPPYAMRIVAPGKAIVGWAQPDVCDATTNSWSEVEAALSKFNAAFDLVREAAARPVFDFQLDYRQGFSLLLPHLAPLKSAVQRLTISVLCDLHHGDTASAAADVETMLGLVGSFANERLPISQLVRIAMAHIALSATWELLQSPNLTDEQLAPIQRAWSDLTFIQPAEESISMERALSQIMLERMRNSSAQFRQIVGFGGGSSSASGYYIPLGDELIGRAREARWRWSQSYPDQLRALKGHQVLLESLRQVRAGKPFTAAFLEQESRLAGLGLTRTNDEFGRYFDPSGSDLRVLFSGSVISLSRMLNRVFAAEAARELSITALALKRYQLAHHQFPAQLSDLVPSFLPSAPRDPADGRPMRYRLKPDGAFLLYSVGQDGTDNGGDPSAQDYPEHDFTGWLRGRDLVWPSPATSEEINDFREKVARKHGQ